MDMAPALVIQKAERQKDIVGFHIGLPTAVVLADGRQLWPQEPAVVHDSARSWTTTGTPLLVTTHSGPSLELLCHRHVLS